MVDGAQFQRNYLGCASWFTIAECWQLTAGAVKRMYEPDKFERSAVTAAFNVAAFYAVAFKKSDKMTNSHSSIV